jgi:hypothetical protein
LSTCTGQGDLGHGRDLSRRRRHPRRAYCPGWRAKAWFVTPLSAAPRARAGRNMVEVYPPDGLGKHQAGRSMFRHKPCPPRETAPHDDFCAGRLSWRRWAPSFRRLTHLFFDDEALPVGRPLRCPLQACL